MSSMRIAGFAALMATAGFAGTAQAQTEIPFWFGLTGQLADAVQSVCDRFNASQAEYKIVCTSQGEYADALQAAIAAYRAGKQPAILQVYDVGTLDMMLSGAIVPAYQLMEDVGIQVDWSDYIEPIGQLYAAPDGKMYSFPFNSSTAVMYVNTGLLETAGVTEIPKTWEEVGAALQMLKDSGVECPWAYKIDSWTDLEQVSYVNGAPIATENNGYDGLDAAYVFNTTVAVKYMENLKSWYDAGVVKLFPNGGNARDAFSAGQCGIYTGSIADHGTIVRDQAEGLKWTTAFFPTFEGMERKNSVVGGASLWTFKGFDETVYRGAAAFFDFIRTPESQQYWSTVTGYIPVTNSAYDAMVKAGFYDDPAHAGRQVAIDSLRYTPITPVTRGMRLGSLVQMRAILKEDVERMLNGEFTAQEAMDDSVRRADELLRRFEQTYAGAVAN